MQSKLDSYFIREDIINNLLESREETREEAIDYADRLLTIAEMENAEYSSLVDPFDRSVALVFELVKDADLDPWDIDLSSFVNLFSERIKKNSDNIDLPSCGRLLRLAWAVLRGQVEDLLDRQNKADMDDELDDYFIDEGWMTDFDDNEFNFTNNVISGELEADLNGLFEERVRREEGRPVTLGDLLGALRGACDDAEINKTREENRIKYKLEVEEALGNVGARMHDENLEGDIELCWNIMREMNQNGEIDLQTLSEGVAKEIKKEIDEDVDVSAEAKVTGLVSMLFLTHRGFTDIEQDEVPNGKIKIKDLWPKMENWNSIKEKFNEENVKFSEVIGVDI
jgi:chromatin segregation and condensation protein Rec8/ScpA/Scc1 (kleisin family)|tara:strand:+ start:1179 stop:2198 length:1020 start_codon:yes stop_codon:yes gene_type:complete